MKAVSCKGLSNHEIVTLAVFLLGGDSQRIDTEDAAMKANELAPRRFTWRKYPKQINIETVRKRLWDARKPEKGGYLVGSDKAGWSLTQAGLSFARSKVSVLDRASLTRKPLNTKERNWFRRERERMLGSEAYQKFAVGESDKISIQEAQAFFRVDAYVTGEARSEKLLRARNVFGEDPDLGPLIKLLVARIEKGAQ